MAGQESKGLYSGHGAHQRTAMTTHSGAAIETQSDETQYADIVWLDPATTPKRVRSHRSLEAVIRGLTGKHAATVGHELRLAFARYLRHGYFSLNHRVLDAVHGSRARKQLMSVVSSISVVVKGHSPENRSKQRVFTLSGVKKADPKWPTYSGQGCDRLVVDGRVMVWRMVDAEWMYARHVRWTEFCRQNKLEQRLDFQGSTDWGAATLESLDAARLPTTTANTATSDKQEISQDRLDKLTKTGVLRMVYRRHGRMYHPVTNFAKADRRRAIAVGEATAEVDMHACYAVILASWLDDSERADVVADLQSGQWYAPYQAAYDEFADRKADEMRASGATPEAIADRLRGVKVEWQRQCLFARDSRPDSNPLWAVLVQRHPALAKLIWRLRLRYGVSGLSHMLTSAEGRLFVDTAIPALHRAGIHVIGIHDGLIVPESRAAEAQQILERIAYQQLGFVPAIKAKRHAVASLKE